MANHQGMNLASGIGILGNAVSFLVYLAPLPTFYRICKKKSTEEFQAVPYAVALFSAMLYLYYAFLKGNSLVLITINSVGCVTEILYLAIFIIYATRESRIGIIKLLLLFNVSSLGFIIVTTYFLAQGHRRVEAVGWICAAFSVSVFAAPLSIIRQVIRTKSVEFMPLSLSFFLTVCAVVWFFYGFLVKDFYIAGPNILGFIFGIIQMGLYMVYKNPKKQTLPTAESKVHAITMDLKTHDQHQQQPGHDTDNQSDNNHHKNELEIVVLDRSQEHVPGVIVETNS